MIYSLLKLSLARLSVLHSRTVLSMKIQDLSSELNFWTKGLFLPRSVYYPWTNKDHGNALQNQILELQYTLHRLICQPSEIFKIPQRRYTCLLFTSEVKVNFAFLKKYATRNGISNTKNNVFHNQLNFCMEKIPYFFKCKPWLKSWLATFRCGLHLNADNNRVQTKKL